MRKELTIEEALRAHVHGEPIFFIRRYSMMDDYEAGWPAEDKAPICWESFLTGPRWILVEDNPAPEPCEPRKLIEPTVGYIPSNLTVPFAPEPVDLPPDVERALDGYWTVPADCPIDVYSKHDTRDAFVALHRHWRERFDAAYASASEKYEKATEEMLTRVERQVSAINVAAYEIKRLRKALEEIAAVGKGVDRCLLRHGFMLANDRMREIAEAALAEKREGE